MRTLKAAGVFLVLVAVLGPGVASSLQAARADATAPRVIRLFSTNVIQRVVVDKPPAGTSNGDTIFTTNVLTNAVAQLGFAKGAVAGSDAGRTINVGREPATVDILTTLRGGTLRVRGRMRTVGQAKVMPVIAGTGKFKGATGTLTVQAIPHTGEVSNVYRLRY